MRCLALVIIFESYRCPPIFIKYVLLEIITSATHHVSTSSWFALYGCNELVKSNTIDNGVLLTNQRRDVYCISSEVRNIQQVGQIHILLSFLGVADFFAAPAFLPFGLSSSDSRLNVTVAITIPRK